MGEDIDTLEDVYEPYLIQIGFISRTQRGRVPLPAAYKTYRSIISITVIIKQYEKKLKVVLNIIENDILSCIKTKNVLTTQYHFYYYI